MELSGYRTDDEYWYTSWSVLSSTSEPLSIQAHFFRDNTTSRVVADKLGYSSDQWQTGDLFIQRFDTAELPESKFLETGIYNYQTLERVGQQLRLSRD